MLRHLSLAALIGLASPAVAEDGGVDVSALVDKLGVKLRKKDVKALEVLRDDPRPEFAALAVAMLYGLDPEGYADRFAATFAVPDFAEDALRVVAHREIDERVGGHLPAALQPLAVFLAYKDDPACFETPQGRTSVARFYRSAFLALAWAEAEASGRVNRMRTLQALDGASRGDEASAVR